MSDLPTNASIDLLGAIWILSLFMLGAALLLCFAITLRRWLRNRLMARRDTQRAVFETYITALLNAENDAPRLERPACHVEDIADVLLHYFRTVRGHRLERLRDFISEMDLEARIIESSQTGIRGTRMRALRVLAYLETQNSLQVIFDNLTSQDRYVRLTAARGLVERKGLFYLGTIIEACASAYPEDYRLLAGILADFGQDAVDPLETLVRQTDQSKVRTAALEALVLIMPPRTTLDLGVLMTDPDENVRASALSLSGVSDHNSQAEPLLLGLKDTAISVKIRAAKMACERRRTDVTEQLFSLSSDPVMWVRYWALRAIWVSGQSGEKFVDSLSRTNPTAADVALEMRAGYV